MHISALKFNYSPQIQKNQNNQSRVTISHMSQNKDTVSFGKKRPSTQGISDLEKSNIQSQKIADKFIEDFLENIENGESDKLESTIKELENADEAVKEKVFLFQDKTKEQFLLLRDNSNWTHLNGALFRKDTKFATKYLQMVNSLKNKEAIEQFHLLQDNNGWSHLHTALNVNNTEFAKIFLESVNNLESKEVKEKLI